MRVLSLFVVGVTAAKLKSSEPQNSKVLAKEMSHDLEMNFNKIAPFGKENV